MQGKSTEIVFCGLKGQGSIPGEDGRCGFLMRPFKCKHKPYVGQDISVVGTLIDPYQFTNSKEEEALLLPQP